MAMTQPAVFDEIDDAAEAAADARAEADIRAGRVISHQAMKTWLLSWGSENEIPAPDIGS